MFCGIQIFALCFIYWRLIIKKKVLALAWTRIVFFSQVVTLFLIILMDITWRLLDVEQGKEDFKRITDEIRSTLFNCNQFWYLFFGFKILIVEAQIPFEGRTIIDTLRKVRFTSRAMMASCLFFIIYMMSKWIINMVVSKRYDEISQFVTYLIWQGSFILFTIFQVFLWIYFWLVTRRLLTWLGVGRKNERFTSCCFTLFFLM